MNDKQIVEEIINESGGKENILSVTNCATRLRLKLKDDSNINETKLKEIENVLGLVHNTKNYLEIVVGPGKSKKYADICMNLDINTATENISIKLSFKTIGLIFVPLIPGTITAGLCAGLANVISTFIPGYTEINLLNIFYQLLVLISQSFLAYLTVWAGYRAAEEFKTSPVLGGMLGMIMSMEGINIISKILGLYNEIEPLNAILRNGKGGVIAVILGVYVLSIIEKKVRKYISESLDIILTPLISMLLTLLLFVFVIMPTVGYVSTLIGKFMTAICMSEYFIVRIIAGYIASAIFLPLVASGMHHSFVAIYALQLEQYGYVTLFPTLAVAGAGQVGAAIAIYLMAKKKNNTKLQKIIKGAVPAGILGIGEPLIYGVTLPLGKPFLTAGLGAGFGGAFMMATQVGAVGWGTSGIIATLLMFGGPKGAMSAPLYVTGLIIAMIGGFIVTKLLIKEETIQEF